jgi:hypothetical protein
MLFFFYDPLEDKIVYIIHSPSCRPQLRFCLQSMAQKESLRLLMI